METTPFHHMMLMKCGPQLQLAKVMDEIRELQKAVKEGDRGRIVEEYSDVMNVLPYVEMIFDIKLKGPLMYYNLDDWNYTFMLRFLDYVFEYKGNHYGMFKDLIKNMFKIYIIRLNKIRKEYKITDEEVDVWVKMKRKRYTNKIFQGWNPLKKITSE